MSSGIGDSATADLGSVAKPAQVWRDPSTSSISIICDDQRLTDENGRASGLRLSVNGNPKSADYNLATFKRLA
jgi:hypothetical protein